MSTPSVDKKTMSRREYMRTYRKTSRLKEMWDIFVSNRLAVVGLIIITSFLLLALFAVPACAQVPRLSPGQSPCRRRGKRQRHAGQQYPCGQSVFHFFFSGGGLKR